MKKSIILTSKSPVLTFAITVLLLSSSAVLNKAFATHAAGADLTYRFVSRTNTTSTYEVTGTLYRDCAGIAAPNTLTINYSSAFGNYSNSQTINQISGTGQEITFPCPTAQTTCSGGTYQGYQKWVYQGIITVPSHHTD